MRSGRFRGECAQRGAATGRVCPSPVYMPDAFGRVKGPPRCRFDETTGGSLEPGRSSEGTGSHVAINARQNRHFPAHDARGDRARHRHRPRPEPETRLSPMGCRFRRCRPGPALERRASLRSAFRHHVALHPGQLVAVADAVRCGDVRPLRRPSGRRGRHRLAVLLGHRAAGGCPDRA